MKRVVLLLIFFAPLVHANPNLPVWDVNFPDNEQWEVTYSDRLGKEYIIEWTRKGQGLEDWSELITYNFKPVGAEYFYVMMNRMMTTLSDGCPSFDSRPVAWGDQSMVIEWSDTGCREFPAQKAITRFEYFGDGLLALQYSYRPDRVKPNFEYWKDTIIGARPVY